MKLLVVLVLALIDAGVNAEWKRESVETAAVTSTFIDRSEGECRIRQPIPMPILSPAHLIRLRIRCSIVDPLKTLDRLP